MRTRLLVLGFFLVPLVGCDYVTKDWAESSLQGSAPVSVIPDVFELSYAQNFDVAFNALRDVPENVRFVLILLAGVAIMFFVVVAALRRRASRIDVAGYAFVLAGALGNLGDRVFRGYVVDFMHLSHWPVFNVADAWILIGVALLGISAWRHKAPPEVQLAR